MLKQSTVLTLGAVALLGCGSGESDDGSASSPEPAPDADAAASADAPASGDAAASTTIPADWISVDDAARTVAVTLIAGETDANNRWNFNGYANGEATVVVPVGYTVTVNFENRDPAHRHSVGVLERAASYPAVFEDAAPVFDGAITSSATSMTDAAAPGGGTASITFVASEAGEYALACLVLPMRSRGCGSGSRSPGRGTPDCGVRSQGWRWRDGGRPDPAFESSWERLRPAAPSSSTTAMPAANSSATVTTSGSPSAGSAATSLPSSV